MLLNCHSYYSFGYGTFAPQELLTAIVQMGYDTYALTDINNTSAIIDSTRLAAAAGIRLIAGVDFRNGVQQQYLALAINQDGFHQINQHLTNHLHTKQPFSNQAPFFADAFVVYPLRNYKGWPLTENEFIGVSLQDVQQLFLSPHQHLVSKMVIQHQLTFADKRRFNAHRLLRAIDTNVLLSKLPVSEQATGNELLMPKSALLSAYKEYPQIVQQTNGLLSRCTPLDFRIGNNASSKNLQWYTQSLAGDITLIRNECEKGLRYRYPNAAKQQEARLRMEKELGIIASKEFTSYFLINWDIVNYAASKGYYHVGRGSGANSLVAYLLRITDVDPLELDLYFERFINEHRSNAPDFDIDFSWTDRDDITGYIFKRFNTHNNVALLGSYNTYQKDAVVRELGKVFGLPPGEIEKLQKPHKYAVTDKMSELVMRYTKLIEGYPNHLSVHASGIIISHQPITYYSATYMPPKGFPTTQFSMLEAEDIGLAKFDILSQRGLGKIKDAISIVRQNKGVEIDIHQVALFKEDERVKNLLREGKAIGCFYVESPGMRMLLAKLRADDYLRLVAASSIIRPGVAKSGMMRTYINRYRNPTLREEARKQLPELYTILEETYGVMVYQEDVIRVAHEFAGLTLAEADFLRRGMSWKFKQRNEFFKVREQFFSNCLEKGHPLPLITDIWNQIESFANFAFAKGHSASYAVESYQALYLKAYFPIEYMVATLNNGGGFYRKELYVHEARKHGAIILEPCINNSQTETIVNGDRVYLGFGMIAELTEQSCAVVVHERNQRGLFVGLEDFVNRVQLSIEQLRLLIRAGAFAFTGQGKKELLWQAHALVRPLKRAPDGLFAVTAKQFVLPKLEHTAMEDAFDQMELLGFPLNSPFLLLRDAMPASLRSTDLKSKVNTVVSIVGYLVTIKYAQTSKGERMYFGTFLDIDGNWIDTVHFPDSARSQPFTGYGCYHIKGKVTEEYDFVSIEVGFLKRLPIVDRDQPLPKPIIPVL